uniref:NADH dehydrogenase subunit 6 n=1 Tax=Toxicochlespira sp. MNHN IM 2013-9841 TaxID=2259818 RepID=A0A344H1U4_9COND|nr:NADH dehydrogenase subunit 6 [Toxicochlespira sp. MNHN IM 2013-9841]
MSVLIVLSLISSMLFLLPLMSQPLSLGLVIMISTLFMCITSSMFLSQWYAFILFLIYVGGLLVMFAYVAALSPNVLFSRGTPIMFMLLISFVLMFFFNFYLFTDMSSLENFNMYTSMKSMKTYGIEMVSPQMISILIGLAIILLVNLVVVVKICFYQQASLRPFEIK